MAPRINTSGMLAINKITRIKIGIRITWRYAVNKPLIPRSLSLWISTIWFEMLLKYRLPRKKPTRRKINQRPIMLPLESRLKTTGLPNGFKKGGFDMIKLGTPIGIVRMDRARFKLEKISVQMDWKLSNNSAYSGLSIPGSEEKLCIIGRKNESTRQAGPNQRNRSNRMGGIIRYGLLAMVLNPALSASMIFGLLILFSELVFIQFVILPHQAPEGYKTNQRGGGFLGSKIRRKTDFSGQKN
ncbi:MAG: hypothetical protein XD89_0764 [Anaerolineae bacterium 49_20]|nr:MAG: hypothetical protein XD89_0764 [Anaerolineae bacterium 49_20]